MNKMNVFCSQGFRDRKESHLYLDCWVFMVDTFLIKFHLHIHIGIIASIKSVIMNYLMVSDKDIIKLKKKI